jgi:hypothetical protein
MNKPSGSNQTKGNVISNIFAWLGNVTLGFSMLSTIARFETWNDAINYIKTISEDLFFILNLFGNIVHGLLIPWRLLREFLFSLIPFDVPNYMQDQLIIGLILIWMPVQFGIHIAMKEKTISQWRIFKGSALNLLKADLMINTNTIELLNKINEETKGLQSIFLYLIGPTMEYMQGLEKQLNFEELKILQVKSTEYLKKVESAFDEIETHSRKVAKRMKIKLKVVLILLVLIIIDGIFYDLNFEVSRFFKYLLFLCIGLPFLIWFPSFLFGLFTILKLKFSKNVIKKFKIYKRLVGEPSKFNKIKKWILGLVTIDDFMPNEWLHLNGKKLDMVLAHMIIYPHERTGLFNLMGKDDPEEVNELLLILTKDNPELQDKILKSSKENTEQNKVQYGK